MVIKAYRRTTQRAVQKKRQRSISHRLMFNNKVGLCLVSRVELPFTTTQEMPTPFFVYIIFAFSVLFVALDLRKNDACAFVDTYTLSVGTANTLCPGTLSISSLFSFAKNRREKNTHRRQEDKTVLKHCRAHIRSNVSDDASTTGCFVAQTITHPFPST